MLQWSVFGLQSAICSIMSWHWRLLPPSCVHMNRPKQYNCQTKCWQRMPKKFKPLTKTCWIIKVINSLELYPRCFSDKASSHLQPINDVLSLLYSFELCLLLDYKKNSLSEWISRDQCELETLVRSPPGRQQHCRLSICTHPETSRLSTTSQGPIDPTLMESAVHCIAMCDGFRWIGNTALISDLLLLCISKKHLIQMDSDGFVWILLSVTFNSGVQFKQCNLYLGSIDQIWNQCMWHYI